MNADDLETHQSVPVDSLTLMQPQVDKLLPVHEVVGMRLQNTLEDIRDMSHVELVVDIRDRFAEVVVHLVEGAPYPSSLAI